jgi:hypothetical protein
MSLQETTSKLLSSLQSFMLFYGGRFPSMFILTRVAIDNKYRRNARPQPVRREAKLLAANVILIVVIVAVAWLLRFYNR